jgi:16S rRNA (cytidine1402-2'-O)-methyltransferase
MKAPAPLFGHRVWMTIVGRRDLELTRPVISILSSNSSKQRQASGTLYVVGTPIGNLRDISARALEVLGQVDLIACEDTRHTGQLLSVHGIKCPLVSYFEHNEEVRARELTEKLLHGATIALVTDAGTPGISDPGYRLVRAALDAGCTVRAIPGPSALTAALSIAGLPTDRFAFEGFLPARTAARKEKIRELAREPRTMVFFESPRRLCDTLSEMAAEFGADREAAVVRESSKLFEEVLRGGLGELAARWRGSEPKGEITLVVAGASRQQRQDTPGPNLRVEDLTAAGLPLRQAARIIARLQARSSREIYQEALKGGGESES